MKKRFLVLASALAFGSAASAAELNVTPLKTSDIYAVGEQLGWTFSLPPSVSAPPDTTFSYTIRANSSETIGSGTFNLADGPATIKFSLDHPTMVTVTVVRAAPQQAAKPTPADANAVNDSLKALLAKNDPALKAIFARYPDYCLTPAPCGAASSDIAASPETPVVVVGAAVAPTGIAPSAARPADFDAFWAAKLAELKKIAPRPVLVPLVTTVPGVKLYMIQLDSLGSDVHGYLALPSGKGKFPAMIEYQWAGVYALIPDICANRAAEGWLCLDVSSHDLPPDQANGVPKNYPEIGNTSRETSYFLSMYLRDTQALNWVRTLPSWNKKTLVITGTSMGGQQSLVTAGLNPSKITAVVVDEPSGGDSNAELNDRRPAYPNWPVSDPKVAETARYFDTANFAAKITAPTLVAVGFIDTVCPPATVLSAFNRIPAPKELVPMTESDHNNYTPDKQGAFLSRAEDIFATLLHGGKFVPNPGPAAGK